MLLPPSSLPQTVLIQENIRDQMNDFELPLSGMLHDPARTNLFRVSISSSSMSSIDKDRNTEVMKKARQTEENDYIQQSQMKLTDKKNSPFSLKDDPLEFKLFRKQKNENSPFLLSRKSRNGILFQVTQNTETVLTKIESAFKPLAKTGLNPVKKAGFKSKVAGDSFSGANRLAECTSKPAASRMNTLPCISRDETGSHSKKYGYSVTEKNRQNFRAQRYPKTERISPDANHTKDLSLTAQNKDNAGHQEGSISAENSLQADVEISGSDRNRIPLPDSARTDPVKPADPLNSGIDVSEESPDALSADTADPVSVIAPGSVSVSTSESVVANTTDMDSSDKDVAVHSNEQKQSGNPSDPKMNTGVNTVSDGLCDPPSQSRIPLEEEKERPQLSYDPNLSEDLKTEADQTLPDCNAQRSEGEDPDFKRNNENDQAGDPVSGECSASDLADSDPAQLDRAGSEMADTASDDNHLAKESVDLKEALETQTDSDEKSGTELPDPAEERQKAEQDKDSSSQNEDSLNKLVNAPENIQSKLEKQPEIPVVSQEDNANPDSESPSESVSESEIQNTVLITLLREDDLVRIVLNEQVDALRSSFYANGNRINELCFKAGLDETVVFAYELQDCEGRILESAEQVITPVLSGEELTGLETDEDLSKSQSFQGEVQDISDTVHESDQIETDPSLDLFAAEDQENLPNDQKFQDLISEEPEFDDSTIADPASENPGFNHALSNNLSSSGTADLPDIPDLEGSEKNIESNDENQPGPVLAMEEDSKSASDNPDSSLNEGLNSPANGSIAQDGLNNGFNGLKELNSGSNGKPDGINTEDDQLQKQDLNQQSDPFISQGILLNPFNLEIEKEPVLSLTNQTMNEVDPTLSESLNGSLNQIDESKNSIETDEGQSGKDLKNKMDGMAAASVFQSLPNPQKDSVVHEIDERTSIWSARDQNRYSMEIDSLTVEGPMIVWTEPKSGFEELEEERVLVSVLNPVTTTFETSQKSYDLTFSVNEQGKVELLQSSRELLPFYVADDIQPENQKRIVAEGEVRMYLSSVVPETIYIDDEKMEFEVMRDELGQSYIPLFLEKDQAKVSITAKGENYEWEYEKAYDEAFMPEFSRLPFLYGISGLLGSCFLTIRRLH